MKFIYDLLREQATKEDYLTDGSFGSQNTNFVLISEIKKLSQIIEEQSKIELDLKMHLYETKNKLKNSEIQIFDLKKKSAKERAKFTSLKGG